MTVEAGPSHRPVSPSPFPRLGPVLSRISISRVQSPPPRSDGYDNFPLPLPSDPVELERRLTADPEIERQMAEDDIGPPPEGGREAWLCVCGAFFVLFCIFGFATSFGQLKTYYKDHQLAGYSESEIA
jgi:MCP family monocarboxylic acid transporter-like MFS transporter 10